MSKIKEVKAREIFDSRGNPTVEVEVKTDDGNFIAKVPSGASTGEYEALELRDNDERYNGKGVLKAVRNVNEIIAPRLIGKNPENQAEIDKLIIKLDGTENKKKLGANAILGISMAVCRAGASGKKIPLYRHISEISGNKKILMPVPSFNVINGGRHAKNKLSIQEFMILPIGASNFQEAMKLGKEVYDNLGKIIKEKYGNEIPIGDEGGFALPLADNKQALDLLREAILKSKDSKKIRIGIDAAASEFYKNGKYDLNFKAPNNKKDEKTGEEMIDFYKEIIKNYNLISIEDPFEQNDWGSYSKFMKEFGGKIQVIGDDLLVTNPKRIKEAIKKKACNALILKINQIGTITEAIDAFRLAKKAGWKIMVSHRSGETQDSFIADLAAGLGAEEIKAGAPFKPERLAKYNRLLEIEREIIEKGE